MKKTLDLLVFFIASAFFLSHVQTLSASLPKYETQYFMELPSAFLNSLNKDEQGNAILWHPRLTVTKIHTLHDDPSSLSNFKAEPVKETNSNFLSFLQIKQTNQGTDRLTFIPGNPNITDSAIQASKMNCECRFVKDSNPFTLLQTQTSPAPLSTQESESPNLIQTETEKTVSSDSVPDQSALLSKNSKIDEASIEQTTKTENEGIESLSVGSFENQYQGLNDNLEQLVQKNELLKAQLENQSLKGALEKERLEKEREELLKNFELNQRLKTTSNNYDTFGYQGQNQNTKNNDYLLALLKQSETSNSNNLDMNDFYEFQKYQQYKSMMTVQNSNSKNIRLGNNYQGFNDQQQSDYNLVERIASVKDEALRRELIKAFID